MKIAILGAGFTGLSAALKLAENGHDVTILEKEASIGGLAAGFKEKDWDWHLDQNYHHFFTSDKSAITLAKKVHQTLITKRPQTKVLVKNQMLPFDSPLALLKFPHLPVTDRLRVGFTTFYLKYIGNLNNMNGKTALPWLQTYMGKKSTDLIWEPLFWGKFGGQMNQIALTWFWARIKKRTTSLMYPEGGFQSFAEKIAQEIRKLGGKILLNTEILSIGKELNVYCLPSTAESGKRKSEVGSQFSYDKIIVTLPSPIFTKKTKLPPSYMKRLSSIPHLTALNLVLILKEPFFKDHTYWLNITDKSFPFLVLAEHTNFMDPKYYNNQHILYIGNYLPKNHPYLKMSTKELLHIYQPYLQKISPLSPKYPLSVRLFISPNAQPIVTPNYQKLMPGFHTPLKNVYLANLDMVYPWDRGVNYAIELGEKVAKQIANIL